MPNLQSAIGIAALIALAWILSEQRRAVAWRNVVIGVALTVALAALLLKAPPVKAAFAAANRAVDAVAAATRAGTSFVFGYLGGGPLPFEPKIPGSEFILAFQALPIVLVVSVLTTLLFYWGILPPVVRALSRALERTLNIGGAVGLSTAANIFVGMVEAPLFIKPYLAQLTRSELFIVMTGGMAGIAGTVLVLYATLLGPMIPDAAGHFIVASVLGAPAAIVIAQVMVPETFLGRSGGEAEARAGVQTTASRSVDKFGSARDTSGFDPPPVANSTMDAIVKGTTSGLELLLNIVAMLIVLVALVHLANAALSLLPAIAGAPITLQRLLGLVMAPICWAMGVPWDQAPAAGALMGVKTVLNEFIAYLELAQLPPGALDERSRLIMLYALCGFANFGSLGIMIGGLTVMAPERRDDILSLGFKSIVSGTLATCLLGAVVGVLS